MEIMMRAREASNPKLQFLNPDNPYHPIYKQVCWIITLNYLQRIIDQTACYACKNGVDNFPVLSKFKPEQFEFLNPESKYHMFYKYKIALYKELFGLAQNGSLILTSKKKFPVLKGFF